jgi:hypothetical protein
VTATTVRDVLSRNACTPNCLLGAAPRGSGCGERIGEADPRQMRVVAALDCTCACGGRYHGALDGAQVFEEEQ